VVGWIIGSLFCICLVEWVAGLVVGCTDEQLTGCKHGSTDNLNNVRQKPDGPNKTRHTPQLMNSTRHRDTPQIFVSDFINGRDETV